MAGKKENNIVSNAPGEKTGDISKRKGKGGSDDEQVWKIRKYGNEKTARTCHVIEKERSEKETE